MKAYKKYKLLNHSTTFSIELKSKLGLGNKIRERQKIENNQKNKDFEIKIGIKIDSEGGNRFSKKFYVVNDVFSIFFFIRIFKISQHISYIV